MARLASLILVGGGSKQSKPAGFTGYGLFYFSAFASELACCKIKKPWLTPRLALFCRDGKIRTCDLPDSNRDAITGLCYIPKN